MVALGGLFGLILILVLCSIIPVVIGVIVYNDAKQRGMNAALWALIAVLAPTFIGLIVYLLIRGNYSNLKCPSCETSVTEQYIVCPKCGTRLKASCQNCGTQIKTDWAVCPNCAVSLADNIRNYSSPVVKKDKIVSKTLIAVFILVPILLLVPIGIGLMVRPSASGSWSISSSQTPIDTYKTIPEVSTWLESSTDSSKIYALRYRDERRDSYLFYSPSGNIFLIDAFQKTVDYNAPVFLFGESSSAKDTLSKVTIYNSSFQGEVIILLYGEVMESEITETDYNFTQYEAVATVTVTPNR